MPSRSNVKSAKQPDHFSKVREMFRLFLRENNLRPTPQRFAVLEEIDSLDGHFDADELHLRLIMKGERVSRATVYTTLGLLQAADLIKKHQFGQNQAKYEPAFRFRQHDHLICSDCGEVFEFCDPRIHWIQRWSARSSNSRYNHTRCKSTGAAKDPIVRINRQHNIFTVYSLHIRASSGRNSAQGQRRRTRSREGGNPRSFAVHLVPFR